MGQATSRCSLQEFGVEEVAKDASAGLEGTWIFDLSTYYFATYSNLNYYRIKLTLKKI